MHSQVHRTGPDGVVPPPFDGLGDGDGQEVLRTCGADRRGRTGLQQQNGLTDMPGLGNVLGPKPHVCLVEYIPACSHSVGSENDPSCHASLQALNMCGKVWPQLAMHLYLRFARKALHHRVTQACSRRTPLNRTGRTRSLELPRPCHAAEANRALAWYMLIPWSVWPITGASVPAKLSSNTTNRSHKDRRPVKEKRLHVALLISLTLWVQIRERRELSIAAPHACNTTLTCRC